MTDLIPRPNLIERHYFLLRRLHSLSGVVPIGAFLLPHLTTNSSVVWGKMLNSAHVTGEHAHAGVETFQHEVDFIHSLPALILIEIFVLWLPIAFHAGLGVHFARTGKSNVNRYAYQDNWRYTLQRWSGYVGVLFIFYHLATLRWGWSWLPLAGTFDPEAASSTTAIAMRGGVEEVTWRMFVVSGLYLMCVLALVYHFANGLWTAAITWGLTVTTGAQRRWGYVCGVIGVGLAVAGITAIVGFASLDIEQARAIEGQMHASTEGEQ